MTATTTLTREQVRRIDRIAVDRYRIPSIVLMENAARQLADQADAMLDAADGRAALVVCGGGNNGGDGLAAARHLRNRGRVVTVAILKPFDRYDGDARVNLDICLAMGMNLVPADADPVAALSHVGPVDLVIDAVLGTGLSSQVKGSAVDVINWLNDQPAPILAADTPSGLDCDTGRPLGAAVRARRTVTFVAVKAGFTQPGADEYTGQVVVADIGAPPALIDEVRRADD